MRLARLSISNFKSIRSQVFEPTGFGCLVGENNAGKSSVMQAVVTALNRPAQLPASLFYDHSLPINFSITFSEVDDRHLARLAPEHRTKISEIIADGELTLLIRYTLGEKVEIKVQRLVPTNSRYHQESIDAAFSNKRGAAAIKEAIIQAYPEFVDEMPDTLTTIGAAKFYLGVQIAKLSRDELTLAEAPLPSGISTSISTLLPEPIYIPAVKNLSDDLKTTQTTSFGRLLGLLLEDMTPDLAEINRSLDALNSLLNRVIDGDQLTDRRHAKVQELESLVEGLLGENFPNVKVQLHIPPPELKTILNTAQIFIDDGSKDLIENKGDGIKRSLTFALLQAYVRHLDIQASATTEDGVAARPLLFLFEEPELYLHPRSQRVLFNTLARISNSHQVVLTTHSPLFFAPGVTAAFIRVAKQACHPKPEGVLYPVNFSLDHVSAEVFRLAKFEHADAAFFSQRVVLFEGESDDSYCRHVAKLLNEEWDFERKNVALVRVSGKGNFAKFRRFFSSFGIEVKIVADLDAIFDGFHHLGANQATSTIRDQTLQFLDQRIRELGTKAEPLARQVKGQVQQASWQAKYELAKNSLRSVQATGQVDTETLAMLDSLFTWEQETARSRVCEEDSTAASSLVPLLDSLRDQGICVLSRGAIEDYYPLAAPKSGAKPERALIASTLVNTFESANALAAPLAAGRPSELHQIFEELFR